MILYVKLNDDNYVESLATVTTSIHNVEVELDTEIDLEKITGYTLESTSDGKNKLVFDEEYYNEQIRKQREDEEMRQAIENRDRFVDSLLLSLVNDSQALMIKALFPEWTLGVTYEVGTRVKYGENLVKVVVKHTTSKDIDPVKMPAYYEVLG